MRVGILAIAGTVATLAGCTMNSVDRAGGSAGGQRNAAAVMRNVAGMEIAQATAAQSGDNIRLRVETSGMAPGTYGIHVHTTGQCDAPDFTSAGPHWNPTGRQHGKNNSGGMHHGDLPNLLVGTDGRGVLEITIPGASLFGGPAPLLDPDGAAIVIHQSADDYRSDPSGNSGARIACGVFG